MMQATAICHIEMVEELAALQTAVTSATELMLGRSPDENFWVEIVDELIAQSHKLEELCLWLEWPDAKICDPLLGSPHDQARWADCLDEAARRLEVELTAWRKWTLS
jgi:hypothetical protein